MKLASSFSTAVMSDLKKIRNRNEKKVLRAMEKLFEEVSANLLTDKDLCDIYALALNTLPCQYAQPGTIILGTTPEDLVERAVLSAYDSVVERPKD